MMKLKWQSLEVIPGLSLCPVFNHHWHASAHKLIYCLQETLSCRDEGYLSECCLEVMGICKVRIQKNVS